ncbi:MAG: hypothetical protein ACXVB9_03625 [Bdellovibrionota bacterium]
MLRLYILAVYTLFSLANSPAATARNFGNPLETQKQLYQVIKDVPGAKSLRCLLDDYSQIVGASGSDSEVIAENSGLNRYIKSDFLRLSPEAQARTKAFYDEINQIPVPALPDPHLSFVKDQEAPSMAETSGDVAHPQQQPGWLWKLALRHAAGDPNLASKMIGMCGHDNTFQDSVTLNGNRIQCPTGYYYQLGYSPAFFLSESLGPGIGISQALQKKIAEAQAPFTCAGARSAQKNPDPKACLPSKEYHVYGAEYVACEMIARGHNPRLVVELEAAMGWYYRGYWLANEASKCDVDLGRHNPSPAKVQKWLDLLAEVRHLGRSTSCSSAELMDQLEPSPLSQCDQPYKDAIFLARKWTLLGTLGKPFGAIIPSIGSSNVPMEDRPAAWSDERFQLAKAKFKSILSDFEWTMEQHRVGAEFAASHCRPDPAMLPKKTCN